MFKLGRTLKVTPTDQLSFLILIFYTYNYSGFFFLSFFLSLKFIFFLFYSFFSPSRPTNNDVKSFTSESERRVIWFQFSFFSLWVFLVKLNSGYFEWNILNVVTFWFLIKLSLNFPVNILFLFSFIQILFLSDNLPSLKQPTSHKFFWLIAFQIKYF